MFHFESEEGDDQDYFTWCQMYLSNAIVSFIFKGRIKYLWIVTKTTIKIDNLPFASMWSEGNIFCVL